MGPSARRDPRRSPFPRRCHRRQSVSPRRDRAIHEGDPQDRLGIMGWADALAALGIAYDSEEALALADRVATFLEDESLAASSALAERRGPFPAWKGSRWESAGHRPLRNATTTTIAPTGTISIIAGCASGIEPLYALAYRRNVLDGAELVEVNPAFQRIAAERGFASDELFSQIAEHGGVRGRAGVPEDIQRGSRRLTRST